MNRDKPDEFNRCSVDTNYEHITDQIETYESLVVEALVNILTNSIEAMPEGGKLKVSASRNINSKLEDIIEIYISDNGYGIATEDLEHICKLNYTKGKEGFGYGLWFASQVFEATGIEAYFESEVGVGTRVKLIVPASSEG